MIENQDDVSEANRQADLQLDVVKQNERKSGDIGTGKKSGFTAAIF